MTAARLASDKPLEASEKTLSEKAFNLLRHDILGGRLKPEAGGAFGAVSAPARDCQPKDVGPGEARLSDRASWAAGRAGSRGRCPRRGAAGRGRAGRPGCRGRRPRW